MFLSFIVPVYNVEKYLGECLDSLLQQDIPREDYEILCVDDGSTDGSPGILREYGKKHANIRVITQKNSGVATARNTGLDAARGEYIWFVDSDDVILPDVLGQLKTITEQTGCDRLSVGTYVFGETMEAKIMAQAKEGMLKVNAHFYDSCVLSSLLKREFLLTHHCRFRYPELTHGEDSIFMFETVAQNPRQETLDIPVYFYRTRPGSAQNNGNVERKMRSYLLAAQIMHRHYLNKTGSERDCANLLMSYIWYTMHMATMAQPDEGKKAVQALRSAGLYPFRRPAACTHVRSYQTARTDIVGKIFDKVYINLHRPWGYCAMWLLQKLIRLKHSLGK